MLDRLIFSSDFFSVWTQNQNFPSQAMYPAASLIGCAPYLCTGTHLSLKYWARIWRSTT